MCNEYVRVCVDVCGCKPHSVCIHAYVSVSELVSHFVIALCLSVCHFVYHLLRYSLLEPNRIQKGRQEDLERLLINYRPLSIVTSQGFVGL